ncbi:MAG: hypothetical protein JSW71_05355 [Gemmatimonadota bacterium]|nr:MAG: hypothetical protein JSW71_05355 [Gemmatimonadota bacterium]
MRVTRVLGDFLTVFVLAFAVSAVVSLIWNLIAHGSVTVDWGSSLSLGIVLGIVVPWMGARQRKSESP